VILFCILLAQYKKIAQEDEEFELERRSNFFITFCFYVSVFLLVTHELTAFYNLDFMMNSFLAQNSIGYRAFTLTLWWIILGSYLIFMSSKKPGHQNEKALGLALIGITVLKIFLYDLVNVDTNFKVLGLVIVGSCLLGISYYSSKKGLENDEN